MGQALINAFDHGIQLSEEELRAVAGGNGKLTNALPEMSTGMSGILSMGSAPPLAEAVDHASLCALPEVCSGIDLVDVMMPQGDSIELPDAPIDDSGLPGPEEATSDVHDSCVGPSDLLGRVDEWLSDVVDPLNPETTPESAPKPDLDLPEGRPVLDLDAKGGGMEAADASHEASSLPEIEGVRDGAGSPDHHGAIDRGSRLPEAGGAA